MCSLCYRIGFVLIHLRLHVVSFLEESRVIEAFNFYTSRYLDGILNIENPNFEQMLGQIYSEKGISEPLCRKRSMVDT